MGLLVDIPEDLEPVIRSQLDAWTAELKLLRREPSVEKFLDLQAKIDRADTFVSEAVAPPLANRSWPFDPYDAFEFARDLVGQQISTHALSRLAYGRFPEMSNAGRRLMMDFLIDNGVSEVARTTSSGRPTWYRFLALQNEGFRDKGSTLGIPLNELSALKSDDLDDLVVLRVPAARAH